MRNTKTQAVQRIVLAGMVALVAALSLVLVSCGPIAEEAIRMAITEELDGIKAGTDEDFNAMVDSFMRNDELDQVGIGREEFYAVWMNGFDYAIDDIAVEGDKATASVTITHRSIDEATEIYTASVMDYMEENLDMLTDMTEEALDEYLESDEFMVILKGFFMDALRETPMSSASYTLEYTMNGRVWDPSTSSATKMFNTIFS
ncbi:MAG: hypothetical protein FWG23_07560 [Eggerthellaceae bacterium]|nr:hypothetical protein [Eggerthellaceae bacterium]